MKTLMTILKRSLYLFIVTTLISPVILLAQPAGYNRLEVDWYNASDETGPPLGTNAPFDDEGNVYISENRGVWSEEDPNVLIYKYQVTKYTPDGQFVSAFGTGENEAIHELTLQVALDNEGKFYLTTIHEDINPNGFCISVRDQNGKFLKAIVHEGTGYDSLIHRLGSNFVFDKDWNIVVVDKGDNSVKRFSRQGKLLNRYVGPGLASNQFFRSVSIAYDRVSQIFYIADPYYNRMLVYDHDFNLVRSLTRVDGLFDNIFQIIVHPLTNDIWINLSGGNIIYIVDGFGADKGTFVDEVDFVKQPLSMDMSGEGVFSLFYLNDDNHYLYSPITTSIHSATSNKKVVLAYTTIQEGEIRIIENSGMEVKEVTLSNLMGQTETHSGNHIQTKLKGMVIANVIFKDGSSGMAKLVMK